MKQVLLASHAKLAEGFMSAVELIVGKQDNVSFLSAYTGEDKTPLPEKIEAYFSGVSDEDQIIVLTDLLNGSVNQAFMPYVEKKGIKLITGVSLDLAISLIMEKGNEHFTDEEIEEIIDYCRMQMKFMNKVAGDVSDDFEDL